MRDETEDELREADRRSVLVGVVVAVRNCLHLTQGMIASIRTKHPYRIYVIDDRSDAETKEWLASQPELYVFHDPPLGTGVAYNWNAGIAAALEDGCTHVVVANNDIVFHPATIDLMIDRIDHGNDVLVTAHDVGGMARSVAEMLDMQAGLTGEDERLEFPCFVVMERTLQRIGWFDEAFFGAYFEDNDFHARIAIAREPAVRLLNAPVFHYGTATIRASANVAAEIGTHAARNREYFIHKWGSTPVEERETMRRSYFPSPFNRPRVFSDAARQRIQDLFESACVRQGDISGHLDYLYRMGSSIRHITELSPGGGQSTCAFLKAMPRSLVVYQPGESAHLTLIAAAARLAGIGFQWIKAEAEQPIEETDLLFIDTWHVEEQMRLDLERHADRVRRYIVLHDTVTFSRHGETRGYRGIWPAVSDFLRKRPEWCLRQHFPHDNGLTVLARRCLEALEGAPE